jgi:suppressor of ftsI
VRVREGAVSVSYADQFATARQHEDIRGEITALRPFFDEAVDKRLRLTVDMDHMDDMDDHRDHMMFHDLIGGIAFAQMDHGDHMGRDGGRGMGGSNPIEWEDDMPVMNRQSTNRSVQWNIIDEDTGLANMDIDWEFEQGDVVKISIVNDRNSMHPMQHPMHLHGQRFLVLTTNGERHDNLVWKDTVLIQTGDTVELLVEMTNPGTWMLHCHIAEHLESGMMMPFIVK